MLPINMLYEGSISVTLIKGVVHMFHRYICVINILLGDVHLFQVEPNC